VTFAAVSVVWGMPYLFIKVAVEDGVSPAFLSFVRVALAAAVLLPLAWRMGALRGLRGKLAPLAAFALAEVVVPFPLIAFGEQHVSSSLAAIIIAALPLTIALLAIRFDHEERVHGARLVGLFIGLGGVIVLFGIDVSGSTDELVGALAILAATVGYAIGPMLIKRHLRDVVHPIGPMGVALAIAAAFLAPAALLSAPGEMPTGDAVGALLVLGFVCTALAFVLWFTLIAEVGPSKASIITYVNPVVAVALGVTLLGESLSASAVAGLLLILAGSWLSTGGRPPSGLAGVVGRALSPAAGYWSGRRSARHRSMRPADDRPAGRARATAPRRARAARC
jgi:drug/metabolite transporter (DMT)-like permease